MIRQRRIISSDQYPHNIRASHDDADDPIYGCAHFQHTDPIIGLTVVITTAAAACTMNNIPEGGLFASDNEEYDGSPQHDSASAPIEAKFPPLLTIWECPLMNLEAREDPDEEGKYVNGWTCGHCPRPTCGVANNFFKHANATKALHHVLKTPSQGIRPCKGSIPYLKKVQYKSLLMTSMVKKREFLMRRDEMSDEINAYQDRTLAAHFMPLPPRLHTPRPM